MAKPQLSRPVEKIDAMTELPFRIVWRVVVTLQ
jgi:hypothetical protein